MADRQRDLLFGLLTVQLKVFRPSRLDPVCDAWEQAPETPLCEHFLQADLLMEEDVRLINTLADALIQQHGGSVEAALEELGGIRYAEQMLGLSEAETVGESDFATKRASDTFYQRVELQAEKRGEGPGRYTLVREHARGGMGRILVVYDDRLERQVALKELLPDSDMIAPATHDSPRRYTASIAARFIREAQVAGRLEHPSIVPVYELGETAEGVLYYTMKLVRGTTLHDALKKRKTLEERLQLISNFESLCQAIAYAHSRGVIHRDIKPANVMLGEFGETVVLDWGIAKIKTRRDLFKEEMKEKLDALQRNTESPESKTREGGVLGTPHYMSPEQARGEVNAIDERSDVYSLGAVLYEMLTGQTPYSGKSTHDILRKVIDSQFEPVLAAVPDVPPELAGICEKALSKSQDRRYQSAAELAEDVRRFIAGALVSAYQYSMREVLVRYYRRNRGVVNTAAAFLIILAGFGAYSYVSIVQARNEEHRQRLIADDARMKETEAHQKAEHQTYLTQLGLMQAAIQARDHATANQVAKQVKPEQRGWEWGYLLNRANPELRTVETVGFRVSGVTVSPDGRSVAAACSPSAVKLWNLDTGAASVTCEGDGVLSAPCVFSPDGTRIAGPGENGVVYVWAADSGKLLHRLEGHSGKIGGIAFSPDNIRLASGDVEGGLRLWEVSGGTAVASMDSGLGLVGRIQYVPGGGILAVSQKGKAALCDVEAGTARFTWDALEACVSGDGKWVGTAGPGIVALYALPSGEKVREWPVPDHHFRRVCFDQAGSRLLVAGWTDSAWLFDVHSGEQLLALEHGAALEDAAFTRNDAVVVTCGHDNTYSVWDARTGHVLNRMSGRGRTLTGVDFGRDGARMVTCANEGFLQIWDPLYQTGRRLIQTGRAWCAGLSVAEQARFVATMNGTDGVSVVKLDGHGGGVSYLGTPLASSETPNWSSPMDISMDGTHLAVVVDQFSAAVWRVAQGEFSQCAGHQGIVRRIALDSASGRAITASEEGTARIWDAASGKALAVLEGHKDAVWNACFSPDGSRVLSTSEDGSAILWDTASGQQLFTLKGHTGPVFGAAFSPDGARAFTGSLDRTVRVWDTATGKELRVLLGHGGGVRDISVSGDGKYLVSVSEDGMARLWDLAQYESLITFPEVHRARFLSSSHELAIVSSDGRVELWSSLPGPQAMGGVEEHVAAFRAADYAKAQECLLPATMPEKINLITTLQSLDASLRGLAASLRTDTRGGQVPAGVMLTNGPCARTVERLGLQPGDVLMRAGSVDLSAGPAGAADVERALDELPKATGTYEIVLERHGVRVPVTIFVREREVKSIRLSPAKADLVSMLRIAVDGIHRTNGLYAPADKHNGPILLMSGFGNRAEEETLLRAGLASFEQLLSLNDQPFVDDSDAVKRMNELVSGIEQGTITNFTLGAARGAFSELRLEYVLP